MQQPKMKKILLLLLIIIVAFVIAVRIRYGGGDAYPDLSSTPMLSDDALEEVLLYPEPIGNVAVNATGRVFFTVHPESRPQGNKVLEIIDGAAEPYPDGASQNSFYDTVLGVAVDQQNRLWTIDHGNHGTRTARLLAFDLETGDLIHDQSFDRQIAPVGSFLQDLQVSADGQTVVIADASFWRKRPAIIVYDIGTASARRVLESHESVSAEKFLIHNHGTAMSFAGGIVTLRGGVDGIALGPEWLYFGAISGSGLYRIPLDVLTNGALSDSELAARVDRVATKPLSDGMSIDVNGNIFGTDIEHGSIFLVNADRELHTLLRTRKIRWPDALSFGPDGWLYIADSALSDVVLKPRDHIKTHGPYKIYRFQPGTEGTPGQ